MKKIPGKKALQAIVIFVWCIFAMSVPGGVHAAAEEAGQAAFTVVFDGNGAASGKMEKMLYEAGCDALLPGNAFWKKGFHFACWNTKADGSGTDYADCAPVSSIQAGAGSTVKLYAVWAPNHYNIVFDGNGATSGKTKAMKNLAYGQVYRLTKNAYKKTGYKLKEWNRKADGSSEKSYANQKKIKNMSAVDQKTITLYARWEIAKYKIVYKLNGGTNAKKNPSVRTYRTKTIRLKNPTRKGYTFKGWYREKRFKNKVTEIKKGYCGNVTLYAKWKANTYTVCFNGNGGEGRMTALKKRSYGKKYTLPENRFKRRGFSFAGWNTKADGSGKKYRNAAEVKNLTSVQGKKVTLYAQWKKLPEKRIWIGDSRGVGIQRSASADPNVDTFICLGAQSYWPWFRNTALPQTDSLLAGIDMERYSAELILMMSINDCANYAHGWTDYTAQNYISDLKALQKKYPKLQIFFQSVGYIEGVYHGEVLLYPAQVNPVVDSFNEAFRGESDWIGYIPNNEYIQRNGIHTADGTHYTNAVSADLWRHMADCIQVFRDGGTPE